MELKDLGIKLDRLIDLLEKDKRDQADYLIASSSVRKGYNPVEVKYEHTLYNSNNIIPSQCNSISFWNIGDEDILLENSVPLKVDSLMLTYEEGHADFNTTNYRIKFLGGGVNPQLLVIRRNIIGEGSYFNQKIR